MKRLLATLTPPRRRRRAIVGPAAEILEDRTMLSAGLPAVEVVGRADDGNWWATGVNRRTVLQDGVVQTRYDQNDRVFAHWSPTVDWRHVVKGDFDGDGLEDFAGWDPQTGYWWATLSDGSIGATTVLAGWWSPAVDWQDVGVLDLSWGDRPASVGSGFVNLDDIVGRDSDGNWWAALSNGDGTFNNYLLTTWNPAGGWRDVFFADLNRDGAGDIIGRDAWGNWWATLSTASHAMLYETVWLDQWDESKEWRDVLLGRDGSLNPAIFGRANDGGWWRTSLHVFGSTREGVTHYIGHWDESAGWRDVMLFDSRIVGRTAGGGWWMLPTGAPPGEIRRSELFGVWNEAAGWRDVQVAPVSQRSRSELMSIVGRTSYGEWWQLTPQRDAPAESVAIAQWNEAANWRDVYAARVTREPVAERLWVTSSPFDPFENRILEIFIYGHRAGTDVRVTSAGEGLAQVEYSVPAIGYKRVWTIDMASYHAFDDRLFFRGHNGDDTFVTRLLVSSTVHGRGGNDLLDTRNGAMDSIFGGPGEDMILADVFDTQRPN